MKRMKRIPKTTPRRLPRRIPNRDNRRRKHKQTTNTNRHYNKQCNSFLWTNRSNKEREQRLVEQRHKKISE